MVCVPGKKVNVVEPNKSELRTDKKLLIVFGDKTADEILPIAESQYPSDFGCIAKQYFDDQTWDDSSFNDLVNAHDEVYFIIGVVDTQLRIRIQELSEKSGFLPFTVIHESADIAPSARIGAGCFVGPQAVVSVNAEIGDFSIIHMHSSIGHDSVLGKHCAILPGARISGEARLGNGVLVGTNSAVVQKVSIGDYAQVDAMTYVHSDILDAHLVSCRLKKPVPRLNFKK